MLFDFEDGGLFFLRRLTFDFFVFFQQFFQTIVVACFDNVDDVLSGTVRYGKIDGFLPGENLKRFRMSVAGGEHQGGIAVVVAGVEVNGFFNGICGTRFVIAGSVLLPVCGVLCLFFPAVFGQKTNNVGLSFGSGDH